MSQREEPTAVAEKDKKAPVLWADMSDDEEDAAPSAQVTDPPNVKRPSVTRSQNRGARHFGSNRSETGAESYYSHKNLQPSRSLNRPSHASHQRGRRDSRSQIGSIGIASGGPRSSRGSGTSPPQLGGGGRPARPPIDVATIADPGSPYKLHVSGLAPGEMDKEKIIELFSPIKVLAVDIPRDAGQAMRFCFVTVSHFEDYKKCLRDIPLSRNINVKETHDRARRPPLSTFERSTESNETRPRRHFKLSVLSADEPDHISRNASIFGTGKPREDKLTDVSAVERVPSPAVAPPSPAVAPPSPAGSEMRGGSASSEKQGPASEGGERRGKDPRPSPAAQQRQAMYEPRRMEAEPVRKVEPFCYPPMTGQIPLVAHVPPEAAQQQQQFLMMQQWNHLQAMRSTQQAFIPPHLLAQTPPTFAAAPRPHPYPPQPFAASHPILYGSPYLMAGGGYAAPGDIRYEGGESFNSARVYQQGGGGRGAEAQAPPREIVTLPSRGRPPPPPSSSDSGLKGGGGGAKEKEGQSGCASESAPAESEGVKPPPLPAKSWARVVAAGGTHRR